jgi:murein DD-endopeptidase MepM/ murein hydrolase activator NlpD
VARSFSYLRAAPFAAGAHRGADLRAAPGARVRAACGGRVVHAGPVAGRASVVSTSCAGRRVSYLPLATVTVRAGRIVRAGTPLGTLAAGHGGLHVGVRRESDPFGYEDPLPFLGTAPPRTAPPRSPLPQAPRHAPAPPTPLTPRPQAAPRPAARPGPAPWPVWAGLAALLAGAAGSGTATLRRRTRARARRPAMAAA